MFLTCAATCSHAVHAHNKKTSSGKFYRFGAPAALLAITVTKLHGKARKNCGLAMILRTERKEDTPHDTKLLEPAPFGDTRDSGSSRSLTANETVTFQIAQHPKLEWTVSWTKKEASLMTTCVCTHSMPNKVARTRPSTQACGKSK